MKKAASEELDRYLNGLKNRRICVVGVGISNMPLIEALHREGAENVIAVDKGGKFPEDREKTVQKMKKLQEEGLIRDYAVGEDYLSGVKGADLIFRTPGVRPDLPEFREAAAQGAVLTSEMEEFIRYCPCPIYGITGSDGKTTTTTVTYRLLEKALEPTGAKVYVGGNIGAPLFPILREITPNDRVVLELSSFQLMDCPVGADRAAITNLSPNHLDYHRDYREYCDAKKNIFRTAELTVLNGDNADTAALAEQVPGELRIFSWKTRPENGAFSENGKIYLAKNGKITYLMENSDIRIPGDHNVENFLTAISLVCDEVPPEVIVSFAREFGGVEHRIELVRELRGVKYYNSSIDSSPNRSVKALSVFPDGKVIMIAGGKDKGIPYDAIGPAVCDKVKLLLLAGPTAGVIREAVEKEANARRTGGRPGFTGPEILDVGTLENGVKIACEQGKNGDVVLLSPASTSFDRFHNFMERGNLFKDTVNALN